MTGRVSVSRCMVAPVPGLRLLLRIAPFLVGALATAVWLQRRRPQPLPLAPPPPVPQIDIVSVVDDLLNVAR
jgi:hypothetical protein